MQLPSMGLKQGVWGQVPALRMSVDVQRLLPKITALVCVLSLTHSFSRTVYANQSHTDILQLSGYGGLLEPYRDLSGSWNATAQAWSGGTLDEMMTGLRIEAEAKATYEYGYFSSHAAMGVSLETHVEGLRSPLAIEQWASIRPYEISMMRMEFDHMKSA